MRIDEAAYLRTIRGEEPGWKASAARVALSGAAGGYALGVAARNFAFDRGWKAAHKVDVPVVSVGNLTLGGTGKTPMVEWIGRWFRDRGRRAAILSRGYGRSPGLNDEGRVLEENLPEVPHLQGPDRVALARGAVEELESEVLILDDGFQHRRLKRDLDIVLLDALDPFGLGRIFPRGLLREPIGSLRRADVAVISRGDLVDESARRAIQARAEKSAGRLDWVIARHAPRDLVDSEGKSRPLEQLAGQKVVAFCGIGNPEGFRRTLEPLGCELVGFRAYSDHHAYSGFEIAELTTWLRSLGAGLALTTQKDLVKLRTPSLGPVPLLALRVGLEVMEGRDVLDRALSALSPSDQEAT